jgi:hypothetical protein
MSYIIRPREPLVSISSNLSKNIPSDEPTTIHTFIVPNGHYFIINPLDKTHYIRFHPRTKDNMEIVDGRMFIIHRKNNLREDIEIYNGPTGYVLWRYGIILLPGDGIQTKFLHSTFELDVKNTILEMGVEMKVED